MKALLAVCLVGLVGWMAYMTWRVERANYIAEMTCGLVYADIEGWNLKNGRQPPQHPQNCSWVDLKHGP